MKQESGQKKLYSFYVDTERLNRLTKLSGILTGAGQKVTVSSLINLSIEEFLSRNEASLSAMEELSKTVLPYTKK